MAQIDTSIPFRAFQQQNVLESFYEGKRMKQQSALGDLRVQGAQNALGADQAGALARGVMNSQDKPKAYQQALQQLQAMGQDISKLPPTWEDGGDMVTQMFAMDPQERSQFERLLERVPENERMDFIRGKLGGEKKGQFRQLSAEEAGSMGLPPGGYNISPEGKVTKIGGAAVNIYTAEGANQSYQYGATPPATNTGTPRVENPKEDDIFESLGLPGLAKGVANWIDAIGMGLPYELAAKAKSTLHTLAAETMASLKGLTDQRMSNQLMDLFTTMIVKSGSLTQGPETAMIMLEDARDMLQRRLVQTQKIVDNAQGRYTKKAISEAAQDGEVLYGLMQRYEAIMEAAGSASGPQEGTIDLRNEEPWQSEGVTIERIN